MVSTSRACRNKGSLFLDSSCVMVVAERTSSERSGDKASMSRTVQVSSSSHDRVPQPGGIKGRRFLSPVLEAGA